MHYAIAKNGKNYATAINGVDVKYSDYDSLVNHILADDESAVFIRDDRMIDADSLHDFANMNRDEIRVIHARAHSRRNAFRECAYCVRDFISPDDFIDENEAATFVKPINSRMSHSSCDHESTKAARAKCRRDRRKNDGTELSEDGNEIVISE